MCFFFVGVGVYQASKRWKAAMNGGAINVKLPTRYDETMKLLSRYNVKKSQDQLSYSPQADQPPNK